MVPRHIIAFCIFKYSSVFFNTSVNPFGSKKQNMQYINSDSSVRLICLYHAPAWPKESWYHQFSNWYIKHLIVSLGVSFLTIQFWMGILDIISYSTAHMNITWILIQYFSFSCQGNKWLVPYWQLQFFFGELCLWLQSCMQYAYPIRLPSILNYVQDCTLLTTLLPHTAPIKG